MLQVVLVYVVTGLKKTGPEWFDGTALWYALSQEAYTTAAGHWLRSQTGLIEPLSFGMKWVEMLGPLLVFSPWRNGAARLAAVGLMWALHLGLQACMAIGIFQFVGLAAWCVFLPSAIWEPAGSRLSVLSTERVQPARWSEKLALVPLGYIIILFVYAVTGVLVRGTPYPVPKSVDRIAVPLHLQEGWAMFSSSSRVDLWFLAPGRLADGSDVEVLRRAPLDQNKPSNVQSAQRGFRWTMYFGNAIAKGFRDPSFGPTHAALLEYLCREWNADTEPSHRLERVELVLVRDEMPRPGSVVAAVGDRHLLATRECPPNFGK
jgi:hypothetical protein